MALASSQSYSDYDPLAWFYDMYWGPASRDQLLPILDEILLDELPEDARILDLACGTGQVTGALAEAGYDVIGIDGSRGMLAYARNNAPGVEFVRADARSFSLEEPVDAVVCLFESLNHIMDEAELGRVFENVAEALVDDGVFLLDMNMAAAYDQTWRGTDGIIEPDHVLFTYNQADPETRAGISEVTLFRHAHGAWRRQDLVLEHRWFDEETILRLLAEAGFETAAIYDAVEDLGLTGEEGRTFFKVHASAEEPAT